LSVCVSTHTPLQSAGADAGQSEVQANVPAAVAPQCGAAWVQTAPQAPQFRSSSSEVVHPVPASAQSALPAAQL
jgi:hypothetical protein